MAQPENVRGSNTVEDIICMSITYHCMEYNQRLKDDLLGEFNQQLIRLQRGTVEMRTYDSIRFL